MTHPLDYPADPFEVARTAAADIARLSGVAHHDIAVTLGSGWGRAAELLGETEGAELTEDIDDADIVLFNTCSVREKGTPQCSSS